MLTSSNVRSNFNPGDVVKVKRGYAKHFLLPRGLAIRVQGNEDVVNEHLNTWKEKDSEARKQAEAAFQDLNGKTIEISQKAGIGGSLYGSISPRDVVKIISTDKYKLNATDVQMNKIKLTGTYPIKIRLYSGIRASLTLEVTPQS